MADFIIENQEKILRGLHKMGLVPFSSVFKQMRAGQLWRSNWGTHMMIIEISREGKNAEIQIRNESVHRLQTQWEYYELEPETIRETTWVRIA